MRNQESIRKGKVRPRLAFTTSLTSRQGRAGAYDGHGVGTIEASDPDILKTPLTSSAERLYKSNNHMTNFVESVRSRKQAICDAEIGHRSATMCHLGVTAVRLGRKVQWNPKKEKFIGDKEVAKTISRPMRKPWDYDMV